MADSVLKSFHASVRPARVVILVDKDDSDWRHTCLRIIEFYSQLWGGACNMIVPSDGKKIDERFWSLLEAFDPDYLFKYHKSGEDIRVSHPEEFDKAVNEELARAAGTSEQNPGLRATIAKNLGRAWLQTNWDISRELHEEVKTRLSPFHFDKWIVNAQAITAGSPPPFHLTNIAKIISNTEHPDRVARISAPETLLPTLWFSAVTGRLNGQAAAAYQELGIMPEPFEFSEENLSELISLTVNGSGQSFRAVRPESTIPADLDSVTPFNLSMLQLGLYRSVRYIGTHQPLITVAGNTLEDFCIYYCLSRLRDRVVWALPSLIEKILNGESNVPLSRAETSFLYAVRSASSSTQHDGGIGCVTYSLSLPQLSAFIQQINQIGTTWPLEQVSRIENLDSLIEYPLEAIERDNFHRDLSLQFDGEQSVGPFNTPKPKHFDPIHPYEHRYITQISVVAEAPPKHSEMGTQILADHRLTTLEARIGKYGPAYFCPSTPYFGGDIDWVLVKPRLRLPTLSGVVEVLSATNGYRSRPSDKGVYTDEAVVKWGGLQEVSTFLRTTQYRALLDRFLDRSKSESGKGVYLDGDKRRYLDFVAIRAVIADKATRIVDDLIERRILYRGFIFGCSYCRNADWFGVGDISDQFKCRRCGRTQVYLKENWKEGDEPAWFYKLDELIYQGYRQGMTVSLLALDYLRSRSQSSFTFTTDREFSKTGVEKPEMEADFFCVPDGVFTVGESKAENCLGSSVSEERSKINKYKHLVGRLAIRQLVFATTSENWRAETVSAVREAFEDLRSVRVTFLSSAQLLGG
jgi:hypothetical protein